MGEYVKLLHIFVTGPILVYISMTDRREWKYLLLMFLGLMLAGYLGWRLYKNPRWNYWYIVHIALFATLFTYMGIAKEKAPQTFYSFLLAIGIAAIGYHIVRFIQSLQK